MVRERSSPAVEEDYRCPCLEQKHISLWEIERSAEPVLQQLLADDSAVRLHAVIAIEIVAAWQFPIPIWVYAEAKSFDEAIREHPGFLAFKSNVLQKL